MANIISEKCKENLKLKTAQQLVVYLMKRYNDIDNDKVTFALPGTLLHLAIEAQNKFNDNIMGPKDVTDESLGVYPDGLTQAKIEKINKSVRAELRNKGKLNEGVNNMTLGEIIDMNNGDKNNNNNDKLESGEKGDNLEKDGKKSKKSKKDKKKRGLKRVLSFTAKPVSRFEFYFSFEFLF